MDRVYLRFPMGSLGFGLLLLSGKRESKNEE